MAVSHSSFCSLLSNICHRFVLMWYTSAAKWFYFYVYEPCGMKMAALYSRNMYLLYICCNKVVCWGIMCWLLCVYIVCWLLCVYIVCWLLCVYIVCLLLPDCGVAQGNQWTPLQTTHSQTLYPKMYPLITPFRPTPCFLCSLSVGGRNDTSRQTQDTTALL
jgi:hypothetical protein